MRPAIRHLLVLIAAALLTSALWAQQDGASIYKSRCANCHGPTGEGKVGPALKGTKLGQDDIVLLLAKGQDTKKAPHKKPLSGLTDEQVKAVAYYVKSLK